MSIANESIRPVVIQELGIVEKGLSKREYFAMKAMESIITRDYGSNKLSNTVARDAVKYADELILKLDQK